MNEKTFETLPPVRYDANLAQIAKLKEKYMLLKITDLNDKEQFDAVHDARMIMVKVRTTTDKQRKKNNEAANKYVKDNNAAAKEIVEAAAPIETHLQTEEDKVTKEKERIKAEEVRIEKEKIQGRVDALQAVKVVLPFMDVATMTDDEYATVLKQATEAFEIELKRIAEEEAARNALAEKLAAEKAENDRIREENDRIREEQEAKAKALQEKEDALKAKEKALEDEKKAEKERKDREAFEKQAAEDAKIQAEKDAKEKAEREAKEKKEAEEAEKAETERLEALKPDFERLSVWGGKIKAIVDAPPEVKTKEAKEELEAVTNAFYVVLEAIVEGM